MHVVLVDITDGLRAHFLKNFGKHRVLEIHQSAAASRISAKLNQVSRDQMTVTIRTGDSTVNISGPTNTQILNAVSNALAANETLQSPNPTVSSRHKPRN
jgi:pyruvate/2-oxoglutarate dehydrogenase complex dihydrolipoamide acyltransferase (E2) component